MMITLLLIALLILAALMLYIIVSNKSRTSLRQKKKSMASLKRIGSTKYRAIHFDREEKGLYCVSDIYLCEKNESAIVCISADGQELKVEVHVSVLIPDAGTEEIERSEAKVVNVIRKELIKVTEGKTALEIMQESKILLRDVEMSCRNKLSALKIILESMQQIGRWKSIVSAEHHRNISSDPRSMSFQS